MIWRKSVFFPEWVIYRNYHSVAACGEKVTAYFTCPSILNDHQLIGCNSCVFILLEFSGNICALCICAENVLPVTGFYSKCIYIHFLFELFPGVGISAAAFFKGFQKNLFCLIHSLSTSKLCHRKRPESQLRFKFKPL